VRMWDGLIGSSGRLFEHGNGPLGSIKIAEFLCLLSGCKFTKNNSALWSYR
jgi:hypothetical protein